MWACLQTIQQLQTKSPSLAQQMTHNGPMELNSKAASMDIFQTLITDLDTEGRYLFLNAIANQLRYPNNHTHFFSIVLLYLFVEANQVKIVAPLYICVVLLLFSSTFKAFSSIWNKKKFLIVSRRGFYFEGNWDRCSVKLTCMFGSGPLV